MGLPTGTPEIFVIPGISQSEHCRSMTLNCLLRYTTICLTGLSVVSTI